ncbi:AI-2E family transporter [Proteobacteria bacterium 005FR1]|nr:AI-2E family transporter [Proteobacteria bacterium 005FR1]
MPDQGNDDQNGDNQHGDSQHGEGPHETLTAPTHGSIAPTSWVQRLRDRDNTNRMMVGLLFFIAVVLAFYFVQSASLLLAPITFAWLLSTLFHPLVQAAHRRKVPLILSSALVVAFSVGGFVLLIMLVIEPASQWVRELPGVIQQLQMQLYSLEGTLSDLQEVSKEVGELASLEGEQNAEPIEVKVQQENFLRSFLIEQFPSALTATAIVVFLTFFLLASGNQLLRKMTALGSSLSARRRIVHTIHRIRHGVAHYLATISVINFGLGVVVSLAMWALGVPNPLLWGLVTGVLNFAPYLGPAVTLVILSLVGISSFDTLAQAFSVPAVFLVLTVLEGQLITPILVGRRLAMSPATVFISVVVWGWLWGVAGALMAVPIVASLKIIFENIPALQGVARVIERR